MGQLTLWPGASPAAMGGVGVLTNLGPGTVYYRDKEPVSALEYNGSLGAGVSVDASGVLWVVAPTDSATVRFAEGATSTVKSVDVTAVGADPAGLVDSQPAFVRAVRNLAVTGGTITGPKGWYYLGTVAGTYGGLSWAVTVNVDNITFDFPRGTVIATRKSDGSGGIDSSAFGVLGSAKPAGPARIANYLLGDATKATYYAISPVAKSAARVTTTMAVDAGNFAIGDWIYLRTGQTNPNDAISPDAEINRVRSVDAATGVVGLVWPTGASYAQEYFVSGTSGLSTTSETANPCVFGIAKINDRTVVSPRFVGFTLDTLSSAKSAIIGRGAIVNPYFDIEFECGGSPIDMIEHRGLRAPRWPVKMIAASAGSTRFLATFDTGCSDAEIRDIDACGVGRHLHIEFHEGCKDCRIQGGRLYTEGGNAPAADSALHISSRARDFYVRDLRIEMAGSANPVFVDVAANPGMLDTGTLENVQAFCSDATKGLVIEAPRVRIVRHDPRTVLTRRVPSGAPGQVISATRPQAVEVPQYLVGGIDENNYNNVTLGLLPANVIVTRILVDVCVAFVSAGATSQRLNIGWNGTANALLTAAAAVDMAVQGPKKLNFDAVAYGGFAQIFSGTSHDVIMTYTTNGAAPTAGAALVLVEYVNVPKII